MFASEGVNVRQQLLSLFAFGGGLEKVENASRGLSACFVASNWRILSPDDKKQIFVNGCFDAKLSFCAFRA